MITIEFDKNDLKKIGQIERQLAGAKASIRRKILRDTAKHMIKVSKAHTREQTDIDNRPFEKHAKGRKRKMLVRLARRLKVINLTEEQARIGFKSPVESEIGAKQQYGFKQTFHKSEFKNTENRKKDDPATRRQAKALIAAGFKRRIKGKRYQKPSIKWIVNNMTIGRAGLILRTLRGSAEFWTTVLPQRAFLGATPAERKQMIQFALEKAGNEIDRALQT